MNARKARKLRALIEAARADVRDSRGWYVARQYRSSRVIFHPAYFRTLHSLWAVEETDRLGVARVSRTSSIESVR